MWNSTRLNTAKLKTGLHPVKKAAMSSENNNLIVSLDKDMKNTHMESDSGQSIAVTDLKNNKREN